MAAFSSGWGRGEDMPPVFTLGRARLGSGGSSRKDTTTYSKYPGTVLDKFENEHGEACRFTYSRTKLLDVYRVTDMNTDRKLVVLCQYLILQSMNHWSLYLCVPNSEELVIDDTIYFLWMPLSFLVVY